MITVLKFLSKTCVPCILLSQILEGQETTDVDIRNDPKKAAEFGVRRVPTLIFLKDNKEVHRHSGILSLSTYESILTEINDSKELDEK